MTGNTYKRRRTGWKVGDKIITSDIILTQAFGAVEYLGLGLMVVCYSISYEH